MGLECCRVGGLVVVFDVWVYCVFGSNVLVGVGGCGFGVVRL